MIYQPYKWGGGYTKSEVDTLLTGKSDTGHTHTKSEITDFPTIPSKISDLTNDSNFITSNDLPTNYVTTDTTQTISGAKTFSKIITVKDNVSSTGKDLLHLIDDTIKQSNEDENGFPLTSHTNSLKIRGHDNNMIPCMLTGQVYTTGDTTAELRTYKYKDITSDGCSARITLYYRFANNNAVLSLYNIVQLYPSHTNTTNLGSPSLQWNDTYTRHILIDNDINIWSSTINKTSNSGSLALRGGTNYSDGASIGLYGKDYNGGIAGAVTINAYGNYDYTNLYIYPNGTISVYNNSTNTTKNIAMQEDVNTLLSGKANSSHTHSASDITTGTLDSARIPNLDASKITSGTIDIDRLPAGALERLVIVADQTARYALTTASVQLGDTVKQLDTGIMYYVVDTANLNSEDGYSEYTAGSATSVPWSGVTGKPSIPSKTSDLTNDSGFLTSHQSLSNYSTLADTVKSLSISGKNITVTPGSGSAYTLTTQDTTYSAGTNLSLSGTTFNVSSTPSFTSITVSGYTITVD